MGSPLACLAAGHRTMFKKNLAKRKVAFRRMLGFLVVPPAGTDCTDCSGGWHEILHDWNMQVSFNLSGANNSAPFALTHMCHFASPH